MRVDEPGADLAVAMAVASAHRNQPLINPAASSTSRPGAAGSQTPLACFGELGLTGELRYVGHPDRRVAEAGKFGLGTVIGPSGGERLEGLDAHRTLRAALRAALGKRRRAEEDDELREAA